MKEHARQYKLEPKYGKLKVLHRVENRNTRQSWWLCECECGTRKEIKGHRLVNGHTNSCGCLRQSRPAYNFQGCGNLSGKYWGQIKKHARNREIEFSISIQNAWDKFIQQNGFCALSGLPIILERCYPGNQTASLDRIDSSKHYTIENIQWVHVDVNKMKNNLPESRLFELCRLIAENQKSL
jgi:hypothetical protein